MVIIFDLYLIFSVRNFILDAQIRELRQWESIKLRDLSFSDLCHRPQKTHLPHIRRLQDPVFQTLEILLRIRLPQGSVFHL